MLSSRKFFLVFLYSIFCCGTGKPFTCPHENLLPGTRALFELGARPYQGQGLLEVRGAEGAPTNNECQLIGLNEDISCQWKAGVMCSWLLVEY